jgi:hypothetical protein
VRHEVFFPHSVGFLMEKGFTDLRFVGTGRVPYVWETMILVARKPPDELKRK